MPLYHCAVMALRAGSIIEPGNWGRIIRRYYFTNDPNRRFALYRETAFELGRRLHKPEAPCRLDSIFLTPTLDEAIAFNNVQNPHSPGSGVIHEVEPVDTDAPSHVAQWALFDGTDPGIGFEALTARVQEYWTGAPDTGREVLLGGAVRILGRVEP